jgi:hypothetical protein
MELPDQTKSSLAYFAENPYQGLSQKGIDFVVDVLSEITSSSGGRVKLVLENIIKWMKGERGKIKDDKCTWHCSSDILESLFGQYKARKSFNSRHGVRRHVLHIPLQTRVDGNTHSIDCDSRVCLETIRLRELTAWTSTALMENISLVRSLVRRQFLNPN